MSCECECECTRRGCGIAIKLLNLCSGVFLMVLGIIRLVYNKQLTNFLQFLLSIYYILFGIIIVLTELNIAWIIRQFSFQQGYKGRGFFIIFIGILCFNGVNFNTMIGILNFAGGLFVCVCGLVSFIFGCSSGDSNENGGESKKAEESPAVHRI